MSSTKATYLLQQENKILWMAELDCVTLGLKLSSTTHVRVSYLFYNVSLNVLGTDMGLKSKISSRE